MRASTTVASIALLAGLGCAACGGSTAQPVKGIPLPDLTGPGLCASVAVVRGVGTPTEDTIGTGSADADHALFDIGSAAKSITAAAVVTLAQDGQLAPSDRISRYLPRVPADKRRITVAELLTHTSGLPQNFTSDQTHITRDGAVRAILGRSLAHSGRFRYSNAGYTLLAAIVERVSGQPFRAFVERRLLTPAGMKSTGWYGANAPGGAMPVDGHVRGRNTGPAGTQSPGSWATLGAGGMTSTATDLTRWITEVNTGTLFNAHWRSEIFRGRAPAGPPGAAVAYGWVIGTDPQVGTVRLVGGDTDFGFTSDLRYFPQQRVATVALSCSDSRPAIDLGHALQESALRT